jgi:hypothetical protein
VSNGWVTETTDAPWRSNTSIMREKSVSDRVSRSILYTPTMPPLARLDVSKRPLERPAVHAAARVGGVVAVKGERDPALGALARDAGAG